VFVLRKETRKEAKEMVQQILQGQDSIGQVQSNAAACGL
jgi:hypothetical protein